MKKQTKIAAVISAAALLAIGASMTSFAATGWQEENGTWVYYGRNGEKVTDNWAKSGDNWFYLNDQGEMVIDALVESNDDLYYVDSNGAMVKNRWVSVDNENAGDDANEPNALWYYFGANGKAYKSGGRFSLKTINGKRYAFAESGRMLFGWVNEQGEMINSDDEGEWQNGEYFFGDDNDGALTVGWKEISIVDNNPQDDQPGQDFWDADQVRWFYFKASGKKQKSTTSASINGARYAFDEYGRMIANWYTDATSSLSDKSAKDGGNQGIASYSSSFRFFSTPEDGARKTKGWFKVVAGEYLNVGDYQDGSDAWYYATGDGKIVANEIRSIGGKKYAFDEYGKMVSGLKFVKFAPEGASGSSASRPSTSKIEMYFDGGDFGSSSKYSKFVNDHLTDINTGFVAAYYFGGGDDGSMKTGNQNITLDDEVLKFNFRTGSAQKGQGVTGLQNKKQIYEAGKLVVADADNKFQIVEVKDGSNQVTMWRVNDFIASKKLTETTDKKGNMVYTFNLTSGTPTSKFYLVNTAGTIVKSGTKKDGNDYAIHVENGNIVKITAE